MNFARFRIRPVLKKIWTQFLIHIWTFWGFIYEPPRVHIQSSFMNPLLVHIGSFAVAAVASLVALASLVSWGSVAFLLVLLGCFPWFRGFPVSCVCFPRVPRLAPALSQPFRFPPFSLASVAFAFPVLGRPGPICPPWRRQFVLSSLRRCTQRLIHWVCAEICM